MLNYSNGTNKPPYISKFHEKNIYDTPTSLSNILFVTNIFWQYRDLVYLNKFKKYF